jgi:hypothetical protein
VEVDVVTDLLVFVLEDFVFSAFAFTLHELGQKSVQPESTVIRANEAASAQAAGGHTEKPAVFLNHDILRNFERA